MALYNDVFKSLLNAKKYNFSRWGSYMGDSF